MNRKLLILIVLSAAMALFIPSGCAPMEKPAQTPANVSAQPQVPTRDSSSDAWLKLVMSAKKEGKLVVYSSGSIQMRDPLAKALKEQFGLEMEYISGRGSEVAAKFLNERKAGIYLPDIIMIGFSTPFASGFIPNNAIVPINSDFFVLPELKDAEMIKKNFYGGEFHYVDSTHYVLGTLAFPTFYMAINTDLVKPQEMTSYADLLNPKFKGKIIFDDPTLPGNGNAQAHLIGQNLMGWDFMRKLAAQELVISRDARQEMDWVAHGKALIAIGSKPDVFWEFVKAGSPLDIPRVKEGTYLTSGSGNFCVANDAPHANAAKLFINWILTKEGQAALSEGAGTQSIREDVPAVGINPALVRVPGFKYPGWLDSEEQVKLTNEVSSRYIKEIFDPLMKR